MDIINNCKNYVYSLTDATETIIRIKMSKDLITTFMSSSYGIICLELLRELEKLNNSQKEKTISFFNVYQDNSTGLYIDPEIEIKYDPNDPLNTNYLHLQTTAFVLSAIDALGGTPKYSFRFLDEYRQSSKAICWMETLNWSNPWDVSNKIMFFLQFLSYEALKQKNNSSLELIYDCLDWLDYFQDKTTGFWGTTTGASVYNAMAGAFHIFMFYYFFKRKIKYKEKIIDNTLALQAKDGLFYPFGGGGSCEDLDAIDILVKFSMITDYRLDEIRKALKKSFNAILKIQQKDGGFAWAKRPCISFFHWIKFANPFHSCWSYSQFKLLIKKGVLSYIYKPYRESAFLAYSGWEKMKFDISKSDIWSTWFRLLALSLINTRFHFYTELDYPWRFRSKPGLGWHSIDIKDT